MDRTEGHRAQRIGKGGRSLSLHIWGDGGGNTCRTYWEGDYVIGRRRADGRRGMIGHRAGGVWEKGPSLGTQ